MNRGGCIKEVNGSKKNILSIQYSSDIYMIQYSLDIYMIQYSLDIYMDILSIQYSVDIYIQYSLDIYMDILSIQYSLDTYMDIYFQFPNDVEINHINSISKCSCLKIKTEDNFPSQRRLINHT